MLDALRHESDLFVRYWDERVDHVRRHDRETRAQDETVAQEAP
jgi:hypothetical protein